MLQESSSTSPFPASLPEMQRTATSSIELHRDAKGAYSWTIKLYFDNESDVNEAGLALVGIRRIDGELRETYLGGAS